MSTSSSPFKKFTAAVKAHHQSVNAAYATYYSGGTSPRSSSSEPASASSSRQNSMSSTTSSLGKAWNKIKEHHEGMNGAFAAYYGGSRRPQEPWKSPRSSIDEVEQALPAEKKDGLGKKMKNAIKDHHRSVNAAYRTYYGA
jgi:hypothetical protein